MDNLLTQGSRLKNQLLKQINKWKYTQTMFLWPTSKTDMEMLKKYAFYVPWSDYGQTKLDSTLSLIQYAPPGRFIPNCSMHNFILSIHCIFYCSDSILVPCLSQLCPHMCAAEPAYKPQRRENPWKCFRYVNWCRTQAHYLWGMATKLRSRQLACGKRAAWLFHLCVWVENERTCLHTCEPD